MEKRSTASYIRIAIFATGFLICLVIFLYPTISIFWNEHLNDGLIRRYGQTVADGSDPRYDELWQQAEAYNEALGDEKALAKLGLRYEELLDPNGDGMMGYLEIPKIRVDLPIYHGLDDGGLQTGVGHMEGSALPVGGKGRRSVLAGHTGLATAKLLSNLDQLRRGDLFRLHVLDRTLTYQVVSTVVVLPTETKHLRPLEGEELVTLITCTPYGVNSHRLLVTGVRVDENEIAQRDKLIVGSDLEIVDPRYLLPFEVVAVVLVGAIAVLIGKIVLSARKKHEEQ